MDWQGQKLAEQIMQYLLLGSACIAFVTGYLVSSYRTMLIIYLVGVFLTFLFTVPEWSFFNRHPLEWAEPRPTDAPRSALKQQQQQQQQQTARKSLRSAIKR